MRRLTEKCLIYKRLRDVWRHMIDRCHNPQADDYSRYGAKGVGVCSEWRSSFREFFEWATANGYAFGLQIDRIRERAGYCPDNCRWATRSQNQINKPGRSKVGFKGVRLERGGRYSADIVVDRKRRYLGTFDDPKDAARAYDSAAVEHFGEFACLNFPKSRKLATTR